MKRHLISLLHSYPTSDPSAVSPILKNDTNFHVVIHDHILEVALEYFQCTRVSPLASPVSFSFKIPPESVHFSSSPVLLSLSKPPAFPQDYAMLDLPENSLCSILFNLWILFYTAARLTI